MNQIEATTIIMNPFPGPEEEMAYCIHCLNPINPAGNIEMEEEATAEYPMRHSESRGWLLYRAMDCKIQEPPGEIIEKKLHTCTQECWDAKRAAPVMENPVLKHQEAICWKAFEEPEGEDVLFCPTCYLPIHLGEGPFNARGYRAELLRRLFPEWFKVTESMFKQPQLAA